MKFTFYVGSLELQINFNSEITYSPGYYDNKFYNKLFEKNHTVEVEYQILSPEQKNDISTSGYISLTDDNCWQLRTDVEYKVVGVQREILQWIENGYEYRVYRDREKWVAVSRSPLPDVNSDTRKKNFTEIFLTQYTWKQIGYIFRPWGSMHIEEHMLFNNALVLHSASIIYKGKTILFTAPSGTGKTTQTRIWHKNITGVDDLNGDRTALQKTEDGWFACGFPIFGSSAICNQAKAPIAAIVVVRQSPENHIIELPASKKFAFLYSQITVPVVSEIYVNMAMELIEDLIQKTNVIQYNCNMEDDAALHLKDYLYGDIHADI